MDVHVLKERYPPNNIFNWLHIYFMIFDIRNKKLLLKKYETNSMSTKNKVMVKWIHDDFGKIDLVYRNSTRYHQI